VGRGRTGKHVTDAELAVLKELWDRGPLTIRELSDRLYPGGEAAQYATVQKLLERLRTKDCVERTARGRGHVYRASVARETLIESRLRDTAEQLCEGSLTPLLTQLVRPGSLTKKELETLRGLVDRATRGRS
jgi:predicted transcriptional regulator